MSIEGDEGGGEGGDTRTSVDPLAITSTSVGTGTGVGTGGHQGLSSTSGTNGNVPSSIITIAAAGGFGFKEPTTKMLLFISMFESNTGIPAFSPLLQAALLKRGLGTAMMLSNMTMMTKLRAACVAEWSATAGPELAETAGDAIMVTREQFAQEHGPGGLYHVPNPLGSGTGIGAAASGSSSSGTAGGLIGATHSIGTGSPLVTGATSGERYKNTMTMTRDKDGNMFHSHRGNEAPLFVIKWQHLLRVLLPSRVTLMLGPDTDLTSESYLEKIKTIYDMVMHMKRSVDKCWTTIPGLRHVNLLRVFIDPEKFGRFLEFQFRAKTPYLLSLNDFLPESSTLELSRRESNSNDMTLLRVALDNLSQVLSVVLGEPVDSYQHGLKPAIDMINDMSVQSVPTSWTCYMISFGLQIVFTDFKEGVPLPSELDKYTKSGAFVRALRVEMQVASDNMPKGDAMSSQVQAFLDRTHAEIVWVAPKKEGGKEGNREKSPRSDVFEYPNDGSGKPMTATMKRNLRRRLNEKMKAAGLHTDGSSGLDKDAGGAGHSSSDRKGSGRGSKGGRGSGPVVGQYGPAPLCIGHLLHLLGVRGDHGYVIECKDSKGKETSCHKGYHPLNLKMVVADEAKKILEKESWGHILTDALKAHAEVVKSKGFSN